MLKYRIFLGKYKKMRSKFIYLRKSAALGLKRILLGYAGGKKPDRGMRAARAGKGRRRGGASLLPWNAGRSRGQPGRIIEKTEMT